MGKLSPVALLSLLCLPTVFAGQSQPNIYDYIVVGSGPGGGPLAANLAKAGASVLLLEAGDDQSKNLNQAIPTNFFASYSDPLQRWDFVKYHSDEAITKEYLHLTWLTKDGQYYVGTEPPEGATVLGVYYPRAGTLGGCSTHNAMVSALPPDSDWRYIADITGDESWSPANMVKYFQIVENNHYVPPGTPGHGFKGYLDIRLNDVESLNNQTQFVEVLKVVATASGQDPNQLYDYLSHRDLNNASPRRDFETGLFGIPSHIDMMGRRVTAGKPVLAVLNATKPNGSKKYALTLKTNSLVTKVLFDTTRRNNRKPRATGVEYLVGKSMYAADPRYDPNAQGTKAQAFARKEVIISAGVFNSPQILKLSGIGPKTELKKFNIPIIVDLPGVGANLQDNNEMAVVATAATDFVNMDISCGSQNASDPCLDLWYQGKGPYTHISSDALMYTSKSSTDGERDLFLWASPGAYRGYWPFDTVNQVPFDPPSTFGFSMVKIHPQTNAGTVLLKSADPRDTPDINFKFWEGNAEGTDADLNAIAEGIEFGRKVFDSVPAPLGPFKENFPCDADRDCDVKEVVRRQTFSHHATSTCAIGPDRDPLAVLDSRFRVRGTDGLRVVDGSAFPRTPGAFPVLPTFVLGEKATEVILEDSWH